jgi:transcription elongation factor GreA
MSGRETYVTKEGYEQLKEEYNQLTTVRRKEVAERIRVAKEFGDLSENAEYDAAKNEQAYVEGRIMELKAIIKDAIIIEEKKSNGVVSVGSKIKFEDESGDFVKEYKIVGSHEADPTSGLISNESPIGQAFLGKKIGDVIQIDTPRGIVKYKIVEVA